MTFTPIPTTFDDAVAGLRSALQGDVLLPGDDGYDAARAAFNVTVQQHPAVIVVPRDAAEVAESVRFARALGLRVAVQATGHGVARAADGAVLIVTARMDGVTVDPVRRTAYVQAGARWGAVLAPAQEHGLAPLLGSSPGVGAIGYTLGGGMGWLARKHGLSSDKVLAFDLVTPEGVELRAAADEHPEVFFALKGGGAGTFGVVTGMEIELVPVSTVYGGNLLYPVELAGEVMRRWRDWVKDVPEALTSSVLVMNYPPFEEVPEPVRGKSFVIVRGVYEGDLADGQALIDEWRTWRQPVVDLFGPMPFTEIASVSQDPQDPVPAIVTSELLDELADDAIDIVVAATAPQGGPPMLVFTEIRHAGGAIRANAGSAANDRSRIHELSLEMVGMAPTGHAGLALEAHLRYVRKALAPFASGDTYLNFTEGREKQERTATAFSKDNLARLQQVKAALDDDDRFAHGLAL